MANKLVSPKSVRRIIVLGDDGAVTVHRRKGGKKRKQTAWVKPFEKAERRVLKAAERAAGTYRKRHDRSSRKRKDGWIDDAPKNAMRAMRKADKALKLKRI